MEPLFVLACHTCSIQFEFKKDILVKINQQFLKNICIFAKLALLFLYNGF